MQEKTKGKFFNVSKLRIKGILKLSVVPNVIIFPKHNTFYWLDRII